MLVIFPFNYLLKSNFLIGVVASILKCFDALHLNNILNIDTYKMAMPCVLSLTTESGYKLPYPELKEMRRDVSDKLAIITNHALGFSKTEVGQTGSRIKIVNTWPKTYDKKERHIVQNDEAGISFVFDFLKQRGFL